MSDKIEFVKVQEFHFEDYFEDKGFRVGYVLVNGVRVIHLDKIECDANYVRSMDLDGDEEEEDYVPATPKEFKYYVRLAFEWEPLGCGGSQPYNTEELGIKAALKMAEQIVAQLTGVLAIIHGGAVSPSAFDVYLRAERNKSVSVTLKPNRVIWVREDTIRVVNKATNKYLGSVLNDDTHRSIESEANRALREGYVRGEVLLEDPDSGLRKLRKELGWHKLEP